MFNKEWILNTKEEDDGWKMAFGAYSSDDNDTYYDAKHYVYFWIYDFV